MRLRYADEAINDIERLYEFIAAHNPSAARRISAYLQDAIEDLSSNPYLGTKVSQAPVSGLIRDLVTGPYVVRYMLHNKNLTVLRIWHQREDWK